MIRFICIQVKNIYKSFYLAQNKFYQRWTIGSYCYYSSFFSLSFYSRYNKSVTYAFELIFNKAYYIT